MEKAALAYELTIKGDFDTLGKGERCRRNSHAVRHHILGATRLYKNFNILHGLRIIPLYGQFSNEKSCAAAQIKKGCPIEWGSLVKTEAAYLINGTIKSATMLMTLIIGLMAGPAVSL